MLQPQRKENMNCSKCSKEAPIGAAYCPWCGVRLTPPPHKPRTRPNGTGTAYKRGRTWTARVVIGWKTAEDGRPLAIYRYKGGFSTKREALEYCPTLKNEKPKTKAPKLIDYWNTYAAELDQLSKSRRVAYAGAWKKLTALYYRPVDQITVAELREIVSSVASTHYTVRDCKLVLTRLFELAAADGWASKDLPSFIVMPKLEEKERNVFTEEEQRALWKLYEDGDIRAAVPLLMICTGMMPGEIQTLKVKHIDLEAHKIIGVGLKTKVRRESPVFLPNDIIPVVEDLIANAQPSGFIFVRDKKQFYKKYYDVLEAAGCRRLEPYCCRHTTATRLAITENIAPQTVQRMMRWSTSRMLDRYAHPDETDVRNAANTITAPR